jgi:hypothetical protein
MSNTARCTSIVGLSVSLAFFSAPLSAQGLPGTHAPRYDIARADALRLEALALYGKPETWKRVASLHEQSARLRPPGDPYRVRDLLVAAAIIDRNGDCGKAGRLVAEAAEAALAVGNIAQAANLYITAAIVTNRGGDGMTALTLIHKAELLANSQLLSEQAREAIRARIVQTQEKVAAT